MRLSAPIFRLKKQARTLARSKKIPLHEALNRIARSEGFDSWGLLSASMKLSPSTIQILEQVTSGDLVLLAARPLQGKTTMALSLIADASYNGVTGAFYSLDLTDADIRDRLRALDVDSKLIGDRISVDTSNEICAPYIIEQLKEDHKKLVVIDFLQKLDQRRDKPVLDDQVKMLKAFAEASGAVIILISQVDRSYDPKRKDMPSLVDVHLPNPIDLGLFTKTCFLNDGAIQFDAIA